MIVITSQINVLRAVNVEKSWISSSKFNSKLFTQKDVNNSLIFQQKILRNIYGLVQLNNNC